MRRCDNAECRNYIANGDPYFQVGLMHFCCRLCASAWTLQNKKLNDAADRWRIHRSTVKKWWDRV
jgi:hypothetical protein